MTLAMKGGEKYCGGLWKEGDHRDWNAIHSCASEVKPLSAG